VVVDEGSEPKNKTIWKCSGKTIYYGQDEYRRKKKSRVSPCFVHLKILKRAFLGDMKR
jgi:hypothetical protein